VEEVVPGFRVEGERVFGAVFGAELHAVLYKKWLTYIVK
jgi:hypothetical protein